VKPARSGRRRTLLGLFARCGPRGLSARRQTSGIAALEFGLIAPLFATMLAGTADLGDYMHITMRLNASISAGSNYAILNASNVSSSTGAALAANIAALVASSTSSNWANATVLVNDGPSASITGGTASSGGTAANADSCYCPTGTTGNWSWGTAVTCGNNCAGGGTAGKFVTIAATRSFTPIFPAYGIINAGTITATTMVQTQ
jgi:Flp pilus assembly protein TadG